MPHRPQMRRERDLPGKEGPDRENPIERFKKDRNDDLGRFEEIDEDVLEHEEQGGE